MAAVRVLRFVLMLQLGGFLLVRTDTDYDYIGDDRRVTFSQRTVAHKCAFGHCKMIKMMVIVVIVFTMCWLPFNILLVTMDPSGGYWEGLPYLWFAFHWLAMSHTCYNPIIYCWMNARFRAGFCTVLSHIPGVRRLLPVNAHHRRAASSIMGMNMAHTGAETSETTSLHRVNTCTTYISVRQMGPPPSRPTSVRLSTVRMPLTRMDRDGFTEDRI